MNMIAIDELYQLYKANPHVFTDSRLAKNGGLFFALRGERFDGNDFALKAIAQGANYAIVDHPLFANTDKCIFVPNALETLQQLANYHRRQLSIPILAITGTNGKTTSKELIAAVLSQKFNVLATQGNLNNHIGVPLTLLKINSEHEIAIIEMGANHPGEIDFLCSIAEPDFGLITNVGKAHLEGFGSFEGVKKTKAELYKFIAKKGKGIFINSDNKHLNELAAANHVQFTYAIQNTSAQLKGELASNDLFVVARVLFPKGWLFLKSGLTGNYNLENILAAVRVGLHFNVDPLLIQKGIETYKPTNNRSQIVKKGDLTLLLDCYNANPSSMEVAIHHFIQIDRPNKLLILGDMLELGAETHSEHQKIIDKLVENGIDKVILVGNNFANTQMPSTYKKYNNVLQLKADFDQMVTGKVLVLIKGSRGIRLEQLVETT